MNKVMKRLISWMLLSILIVTSYGQALATNLYDETAVTYAQDYDEDFDDNEFDEDLAEEEIDLSVGDIIELPAPEGQDDFADTNTYHILDTQECDFGTVYFLENQTNGQERTLWDIVDVAMAGASWAEFFGDPSLKSLAFAALDTVACAPLIPSTAYIRVGGKKVIDADVLQKLVKSDSKLARAIRANLIIFKKAKAGLLDKYLAKFAMKTMDAAGIPLKLTKERMEHILKRHHPKYWNGSIEKKQSFFRADETMGSIMKKIDTVMRDNADQIVKKGLNSKRYQVRTEIENVTYVLGIQEGKVMQFYPQNGIR